MPEKESAALKAISKEVTYGWGMITAAARIENTAWKTSLFPKNGCYIVPLKDNIRLSENLIEGDEVTIQLQIRG